MSKYEKRSFTSKFVLVGILSFLAIMGSARVDPGGWPRFMHDLQNTGYSLSAAPDTSYLLWTFDTGQRLFGSPVILDGTLYQAGRGCVFALDIETGDTLWSSRIPVIGSTPCVMDTLYVGTCNGAAALNIETGDVLWQVYLADFPCNPDDEPQDFIASSPIVTDAGIILCTHRNILSSFVQPSQPPPEGINRVVCLDVETGSLVWEHSLTLRAGYSPAFENNVLYINSNTLKVLSVETGEEIWSYPAELLFDTSPVINGEYIIAVSENGTVYSINKKTHELFWKTRLIYRVFSTPAVFEDLIIISTAGGVFALDKNNGDILWENEIQQESPFSSFDNLMNAQASFDSSPAIADGKVYVGLRSGLFLCLDLETGEILWQYQTDGAIIASPAIADEKIFVASTDGKICCFGIDPQTYFEKAEKYEEQGNTERAREFYMRARDYYQSQGNSEMVKKCEDKLEDKTFWWTVAVIMICLFVGALLVYKKMHNSSRQD